MNQENPEESNSERIALLTHAKKDMAHYFSSMSGIISIMPVIAVVAGATWIIQGSIYTSKDNQLEGIEESLLELKTIIKNKSTLSLFDKYFTINMEITDSVKQCFDGFNDLDLDKDLPHISKGDAKTIIKEKNSGNNTKASKFFKEIKEIITFMESSAIAYESNSINRKMFEKEFGKVYAYWYAMLKQYIRVYELDCGCNFNNLKKLGESIIASRKKSYVELELDCM